MTSSRTFLTAAALATVALSTARAQAGTLAGTVTDKATGGPVAGARILIIGTQYAASSDAQGTYSIRGIPAGRYDARIIVIGYTARPQPVTVAAAGITTLSWELVAVPFTLEEVVITATGEQLSRQLGNSVARIEAGKLAETAPVTSLSDVLGGRVAGVTVMQTAGAPGSASRIRIRGLSSASLSNDPLLYVDGIRVNERGVPLTAANGGESPSFLDDINPEEIESIEVIKGPSAATLYGTQAANGVIRITTKRGKGRPPKLTFYSEVGAVTDVTNYRPAYFSKAQGGDGACFPSQQAAGECQIDKLFVRDLSKEPDMSWLRGGLRQQYGLNVAGGSDAARYFFAGEFENFAGTQTMPPFERRFLADSLGVTNPRPEQLNPADLRKVSLRGNVDFPIGSKADVAVSIGYVKGRNTIAQSGDNLEAIVGFFTDISADPSLPLPWSFGRPAYAFLHTTLRSSDHFINGVTTRWNPLRWLNFRGTVGLDWLGFRDEALAKNGESAPYYGYPEGFRTLNKFTTEKYSVDLGSSATFNLTGRISSRTSAGAQYNKDITRGTFNNGRNLPPGGETFSGASVKESREGTTEFRTLGTYVEEQIGLDDRLFLTGALRVDQNSAFGLDNRTATYPKISASWVALDRADRWLNQVRLRAAYGQSGQQPEALAALTFLSPVVVPSRTGAVGSGLVVGGLGSPTLRPERSSEIEAGFDLAAWRNRITVEATFYRKYTRDAIVARPLPGSAGALASRAENVGEVSNRGLEVSVLARPINGRKLTWDVGLELSLNRNRLEKLAEGVPPLINFFTQSVVGAPLFSPRGRKLESFSDKNGDGIIVPDELVLSDTAIGLGSSIPTRTVALSSSINLFKNKLRLLSLFDYKGGFVATNVIDSFQCFADQNCRGLHDPSAPLEEQAKAQASLTTGTWTGWIEKGDFVRLRELAVSYAMPTKWARAIGFATANVTVTGRNLFLWTGYSGADPEASTYQTSTSDGFGAVNSWSLSQPRSIVFRINLGLQTGLAK
jgi:TonB-linked SusC/RagA family outer membrane protein